MRAGYFELVKGSFAMALLKCLLFVYLTFVEQNSYGKINPALRIFEFKTQLMVTLI